MIASVLGGAGDGVNLVPQASTLNRSDWKAMESYFLKEIQAGKTVQVAIEVKYPSSGGVRPEAFIVKAEIGEEFFEKTFKQ